MKSVVAFFTALFFAFGLSACFAPIERSKISDSESILLAKKEEDTNFYNMLAGQYFDVYSKRATAKVESFGSSLKITVSWSSSAKENTVWKMSVRIVDGKLRYSDGSKTEVFTEEDGKANEETVYTDAEGYFEEIDGKLYWTGAPDVNCKSCVFEKY